MERREKKSMVGPEDNWVKMPREITLSSELNPYQYRVLAILLDRDNLHQGTKGKTWFYCYLGWMTDHSGIGETKVKQSLKELEKMGFISITRNKDTRRANQFHINWDFIKAYKRPLDQQELEGMEDPDAYEEEMEAARAELDALAAKQDAHQEETALVATTTLEDLDVDLEATLEDRRQRCPDTAAQTPANETASVQSSTYSSTAEWYHNEVKPIVREYYFNDLFKLEQPGAEPGAFNGLVSSLMSVVMRSIPEDDAEHVWRDIIKPDYEEYKQQHNYEQRV